MDISTKVNIALSILSFILALISSITVIMTLYQNKKLIKQNNQALETSLRPYISIFLDNITICEQRTFFVFKNFGNSTATIKKFIYDEVLKSTDQGHELFSQQFDNVLNISLAPGQSKILYYDVTKLLVDELNFTIGYTSSEKYYEETTKINVKNYAHIPVTRPKTHIANGFERQVQTLREITERLI